MSTINDKIKVVVTGTEWMGSGVGSIETVMSNLFTKAKNEIYISAYSIGTASDLIFDWMEKALSKGIKIQMIINRFQEQPIGIRNKLKILLSNYPHLYLYQFRSTDGTDLHAKVIVTDHKKALVGSSNLSKRGLISNFEMGLYVEGEIATTIGKTIFKLFEQSDLILPEKS